MSDMDDPLAQAPLSIVGSDEAGAPETPDAIFLAGESRDWSLWAACAECGGYALTLHVDRREDWMEAAVRAQAFLSRVHHRTCLRCDARRRRFSRADSEGTMWWDPEAGDWMMDGQMPGGTKLMLPLDVKDYWSVPEAAAAAAALTTDGPAVRVVPGPEMLDPQMPSIFHIAGAWAMWLPCEECGGCELPLREGGRLEAAAATGQAKRVVELAAAEGCPACVAAMFRDGRLPPDTPPLTWYDPVEDGWMLWQPVDGVPEGVTMPLGLAGFDISRVAVESRVEELLFGDESAEPDEPPAPA
jgi:hypothetical protein